VLTARYALSPYIKQTRSSLEGSLKITKLVVLGWAAITYEWILTFNSPCFCNMHCNRHHLVTNGIIVHVLFKIVQALYLVTNSCTSKLPIRYLQKIDWTRIRSELSAFRPVDGLLK
jgi:hypothetical protein